MKCDCIKRIEKMLTEKMKEKYPNGDIVEEMAFVNKTIMFDNECHAAVVLSNPVSGKVRNGKSLRKLDTQILPTYCPFCGKKFTEGGEK